MQNYPSLPRGRFLRCLSVFAAVSVLSLLRGADDKLIAAVRAADDERVSATKAADKSRLEAIYSKDLHYAHSNGKIDNQAAYIESLLKRTTVYEKFDYVVREFRQVGPGVVTMHGRALVESSSAAGKQQNDLNYLAVWKEENGKWRFFAWQSCKNPPGTPLPPAKKR
jgi:hypothetical protein